MSTEPHDRQPEPQVEGSSALGEAAPVERPTIRTTTIAFAGMAGWVVALILTLAIPAWHTGERSWWPWTCVAGIGLGLFAVWYVRTGRGDHAGA